MDTREGTIYTVGEYDCPHCKRHYVIKCDGKKELAGITLFQKPNTKY